MLTTKIYQQRKRGVKKILDRSKIWVCLSFLCIYDHTGLVGAVKLQNILKFFASPQQGVSASQIGEAFWVFSEILHFFDYYSMFFKGPTSKHIQIKAFSH